MRYTSVVRLLLVSLGLVISATVYGKPAVPASFQKYGLTFPIKELGNCNSVSECINFCDDPINHDSCVDFAKQKGFYNYQKAQQRAEALAKAKSELGCSSLTSCQDFCQRAENAQKCTSFSQKNNLDQVRDTTVKQQEVLKAAKVSLGCDSIDSCTSFCSQESNKQKCHQFAQDVGLKGGTKKQGPGGCQSEESCRAFCSRPENFNICAQFFHSSNPGSGQSNFRGPGGCDSLTSCMEYCRKTPKACQMMSPQNQQNPTQNRQPVTYPTGGSSFQDPATYCKNTAGCSWTNNSCHCSNTAANHPSNPPASTTNPPSSSGPLTNCVGPDGRHFQATQTDCNNFNTAWKNYTPAPSSSGSGGSSSSGSPPSTSPSSGSCDLSCQQSACSRCGGTWENNTCKNPNTTPCH